MINGHNPIAVCSPRPVAPNARAVMIPVTTLIPANMNLAAIV
jgi:hypothetical protein